MKLQSFTIVFLFLMASAVATRELKPKEDEWISIPNPDDDPHVIEIAKFAVEEYNKHSDFVVKLKFNEVTRAAVYPVNNGVYYSLTLVAYEGSLPLYYHTAVYEKLKNHARNLIDFKLESLPGGYFPISNINEQHVIDIAKFAVTKYNILNGLKLKFHKIFNGEMQVGPKSNYHLILSVDEGSDSNIYETIVGESWRHIRELTLFKRIYINKSDF